MEIVRTHTSKFLFITALLMGLSIAFLLANKATHIASLAATNTSLEAENSTLSGAVSTGADTNASNGQYISFTTVSSTPAPTPVPTQPPGSASFQPSAPYYATFFYPWYQNPNTDGNWSQWTDLGHAPPTNWFSEYLPDPDPTKFDPATELYSSNNDSILYWQLRKLAEAKQEVAISSWWGQTHKTNVAFRKIITDVMNRPDNPYPNLRWAIYYECEGNICNGTSDPSVAQIVSDLNYIQSNYTTQKGYLKVNGKPVVFVYADAGDVPGTMTQRWKDAVSQTGNTFYTVLKVFPGFATDPNQPSSWHQYAPAARSGQHGSYSYYVSPGFWLNGSAERLPRDAAAFETAVQAMVASNATWKLTETWNEWGEGSGVEPAEQVNQTTSGGATLKVGGYPFKNLYIDILNRNLPSLE